MPRSARLRANNGIKIRPVKCIIRLPTTVLVNNCSRTKHRQVLLVERLYEHIPMGTCATSPEHGHLKLGGRDYVFPPSLRHNRNPVQICVFASAPMLASVCSVSELALVPLPDARLGHVWEVCSVGRCRATQEAGMTRNSARRLAFKRGVWGTSRCAITPDKPRRNPPHDSPARASGHSCSPPWFATRLSLGRISTCIRYICDDLPTEQSITKASYASDDDMRACSDNPMRPKPTGFRRRHERSQWRVRCALTGEPLSQHTWLDPTNKCCSLYAADGPKQVAATSSRSPRATPTKAQLTCSDFLEVGGHIRVHGRQRDLGGSQEESNRPKFLRRSSGRQSSAVPSRTL